MTITRFSPMSDFVSLREAMDRLVEDGVIQISLPKADHKPRTSKVNAEKATQK